MAFPSSSAAEISAVEQFSPVGDGEYELYQQYYENCLREFVRFKKTAASDAFAQHITHVGQYLFRFQCGRVLKVAIDTHDHREVRSQAIHDWSDIYFKSNRWPDFDYSPKVRPIPIGNSGITLENCRSLRSLRPQPKIFDFIFVGRIWAGGGANVEHNLQLFENLANLGRNSKLLAVVFGFDQKSQEFLHIVARLKAAGVEWSDRQIGYQELMELSAESRLVVLRAGVSGCIAWRMVDMLGLGACIVMDQAPFPKWPEPLQERENFLSLDLQITTDCQSAPEENYVGIVLKMETFLKDETSLARIRENNGRYFDDHTHPMKVAEYILNAVTNGHATKFCATDWTPGLAIDIKNLLIRKILYSVVPLQTRREVKRIFCGRPAICPQIYAWAKANPQHADIVKEFWGPHQRRREIPQGLGIAQQIPERFSKHLEYPLYEKTLFRIKNVTMRGREGILFLPDGKVTHQTGWALDHVTETMAYKKKWRGPEIFKKGNYSTLILYWGLGYYHWFNDVLATLHESLELMPGDTIFVMPKGFQKVYGGDFYLKSLAALGIGRDRVVEFDGTESWTFENFWWQPPAVHPDDQTPGAMQWIGEKISEFVPRHLDEKPVRVYISRTLPFARVLANEVEILPGLIEMGFQVCRLENMTFEEQVRLFRNAEVVVGPHGAGFTNLIFSKPGTRVVEILTKGHERRCYWTLTAELGHEYRFYLGTPKFPERKGEPDIEVDNLNILEWIA